MDDSYILSNYEPVFPQNLHHFQYDFANNE
jgi:hypothetical protein